MVKTRKTNYAVWFFAAAVLVIALFGVFGYARQSAKMKEIEAERAQLEQEYEEKLLEKDYLLQMSQYVDTEEYMERYARYKLGYVREDEIIFETGE